MGSRLPSFFHSSYDSSPLKLSTMEAIRKKMQAMKVEKDNACDRVDASEEQCKAARLRASKAEDEVDELVTKSRQLETELDLTTEKLGIATLQLEEKEKQLSATKLEKAATASDDSERAKKVFQSKADEDEKRITALEEELRVVANNLKSLEVAEEKANQREKTYKE